jgi:4-amino-4-deoxy-L-arabinose transferase-like glycosyltransferase
MDERPPVAWRPVLAIAGLFVAVELAMATRYGFFRDELYFLSCGRRLAFGYVDQPPIAPLFARLSDQIAPGSLMVLRLWPALAIGTTVVVAALIAREVGGGRLAQVIAALCVATSPIFLTAGHFLGPSSFDALAWPAASLLILKALGGRPRLWLAAGAVAGLGLQAKWTMAFFLAGLVVGLVATRERRVLATRWPWLGGLVALAVWAPNLAWQASHGWPFLEMSSALREKGLDEGNLGLFVPGQLVLIGVLAAPVWVAGLVAAFRGRPTGALRPFAVAYVVTFGAFWLTAGKPYYTAPFYPVLLGFGAAPVERWLLARRRAAPRRAFVGAIVVAGLLGTPTALPVLPASSQADLPFGEINPTLVETIGWDELVATVAEAYRSIPRGERESVVVFTANYGEAGAIEQLGPEHGLGAVQVASGQNNWWVWGPPRGDGPVILVGGWPVPTPVCDTAIPGRSFWSPHGIENEEDGIRIWVCPGPARRWDALWPSLLHYD